MAHATTTETTFGTVVRYADNGPTIIYGAGISGPTNQLQDWASRGDNRWPCSALARLDDIAVRFDANGDLVDISGDSDDLGADELAAWTSECLERAGYPNHPAIRR